MAKVEVRVTVDLDLVRACIETAPLAWATPGWNTPECEGPWWSLAETSSISDGKGYTWHRWPLDEQAIANALRVLAEKSPVVFASFIDCTAGSIAGDMLVQCAVLGEVRYA